MTLDIVRFLLGELEASGVIECLSQRQANALRFHEHFPTGPMMQYDWRYFHEHMPERVQVYRPHYVIPTSDPDVRAGERRRTQAHFARMRDEAMGVA